MGYPHRVFHRVAVIMAGGAGERFWPLSRPDRPKQLLRLTSKEETMLEEAVSRIAPLVGRENVYVATSTDLADVIRESGVVSTTNVLAEPDRRNTLGCLSWVAASLIASGMDPAQTSVAVLTADHKIGEPEEFRKDVDLALSAAEQEGSLVTIGVRPSRPETGYGYVEVQKGDGLQIQGKGRVLESAGFREKPNREAAEEYVASGRHLWNSGMFFWSLSGFLSELKLANEGAHRAAEEMAEALRGQSAESALVAFRSLPNLSIDYALLEKSSRIHVVPARFPWDDVGAWDALERSMPLDASRNVTIGKVVALDTEGSILYNDANGVVLAAYGLRDVVVVATDHAILVVPKSEAQQVKRLVAELATRQLES